MSAMQIVENFTAPGQTAEKNSYGTKALLAVIAETATTVSAQLQAKLGNQWVNVGTALTAVGTSVIDVPRGVPLRIDVGGTGITSIDVGLAA